jgi:glycosyl transferase, family 25
MHTFVISLPRFTERHSWQQSQLRRLTCLDHAFVGIDGSDPAVFPSRMAGNFLPGAVGCTLSHVEAYRRMTELGIEKAFILEDDVVLPDNIADILGDLAEVLQPSQVISLYSRAMTTAYYSAFDTQPVKAGRLLFPMDPCHVRTAAAYVIGIDAATNILHGNDPVKYLADDWASFYKLGWISSIRLLHPMPISLKAFESTIEQGEGDDLMSKMRRAVRRSAFFDTLRDARRRWLLRRHEGNLSLVPHASPMTRSHRGNLSTDAVELPTP